MMRLIFIAAISAIALTGCFESKDDFVGLSFNSAPSDLESHGYICKQGSEYLECKNFSHISEAFGIPTKGVSFKFTPNGEKPESVKITVDLASQITSEKIYKKLINDINSVYKRSTVGNGSIPGMDIISWDRPDGSFLQLLIHDQTKTTGIFKIDLSAIQYSTE